MDDRKTIFDYIKQLFTTYGIMVLIFILINLFVGDEKIASVAELATCPLLVEVNVYATFLQSFY